MVQVLVVGLNNASLPGGVELGQLGDGSGTNQSSPVVVKGLTSAKAMKADRDQCVEAGASDYISKPIDMAHLVSLLRVWLTPR